jgi:hypothetical protein
MGLLLQSEVETASQGNYLKYQANMGGKKGFFEFIKDADGKINHRLFRSNPK